MGNTFVVEYYPHNKVYVVEKLIGPFVSAEVAKVWVQQVINEGRHPDLDWEIVDPVGPATRLTEIQKENEDVLEPESGSFETTDLDELDF